VPGAMTQKHLSRMLLILSTRLLNASRACFGVRGSTSGSKSRKISARDFQASEAVPSFSQAGAYLDSKASSVGEFKSSSKQFSLICGGKADKSSGIVGLHILGSCLCLFIWSLRLLGSS